VGSDLTGGTGPLQVRVLGTLSWSYDGTEHAFPPGRPGRLLALLVLARGKVVPASRLVDLVWRDDPPEDPRAALHTTVARVRRALGPASTLLTRQGPGYQLPRDGISVDAEEFQEAAVVARAADDVASYEEALALWSGPPWPGMDEDVALDETRQLEDTMVLLREGHGRALLRAGHIAEATAALRRLAAEAPLRETPVGLLMRALHAQGDVAGALEVYDAHRIRLADELGLDPSEELVALHRTVLQRDLEPWAPGPSTSTAPGRPAPSATSDVPRQRSAGPSLYGRDSQLAALRAMLTRHPCLTVVGPGGVGKTSVASRIAAEATGTVWWVDLVRVHDEDGVLQAVAELVDVHAQPGRSLTEALRQSLRNAHGLLVLDNCEHVLGGAASFVEEVLVDAPDVTVLATSRERLDVVGEQVFPLPPLQVSTDVIVPEGEGVDAVTNPAVALFVERAHAVAPHLTWDPPTLEAVGALVRRLDGLPLAIELAAGRAGAFTLTDLRDRLVDHLELLRSGARRTPARHRTLAATVEWSYDLLDPEQQEVFRGLSVFASSFDLAMVEAVLGAPAVAVVADLVDRSLVMPRFGAGPGRYRLLQVLRTFADAPLDDEQRAGLRSALLHWAVGFVERAGEGLEGPDEARWAEQVHEVLPDVAASFRHARAVGDSASAARIAGGLHRWGYFRVRPDVLAWSVELHAGAEEVGDVPTVLLSAAHHAWMTGRQQDCRELAERAIRTAEHVGDERSAGRGWEILGDLALSLGTLDDAVTDFGEAERLAGLSGNRPDEVLAASGSLLGVVYAGRSADETLARLRALSDDVDNPSARCMALYSCGEALVHSDPDAASRLFAEAMDVAAGVGNHLVRGVAMTAHTSVLGRSGHVDDDAVAHLDAAIRHWLTSGNENLFVTCLRNAVPLLDQLGNPTAVVELVAALQVNAKGHPSYGTEAERISVACTHARAALSEQAHHEAEERGRRRTLVQAGRAVLDDLARRPVLTAHAEASTASGD